MKMNIFMHVSIIKELELDTIITIKWDIRDTVEQKCTLIKIN